MQVARAGALPIPKGRRARRAGGQAQLGPLGLLGLFAVKFQGITGEKRAPGAAPGQKQGPGAHYCTEAQATNDGSPPTPQVQVRNPSLPMLVPESSKCQSQCPGPSLRPPSLAFPPAPSLATDSVL